MLDLCFTQQPHPSFRYITVLQEEDARLRKQLDAERAALEREKAAFAAELAKMQQGNQQQQRPAQQPQAQPQQQQQKRGGWPFGFAPA